MRPYDRITAAVSYGPLWDAEVPQFSSPTLVLSYMYAVPSHAGAYAVEDVAVGPLVFLSTIQTTVFGALGVVSQETTIACSAKRGVLSDAVLSDLRAACVTVEEVE